MSNKVDQKSYLQKYLGGSSGDKKKRKKKAPKGKGLKIIDDDLDLSKLRTLDGDELDIFDQGEDAPQIAGIIDDRPEELQQLEQLKTSSKWKVINQDDGFNSKLQIEEIKKDLKKSEKENELIFGKMYSDSEDEKKNDSDVSPPRKHENKKEKNSKPTKKYDSDSDCSPPRKKDTKPQTNGDSNASPSRPNKSKERVRKPSRWGEKEEETDYKNQSPQRSKDSHKRRSRSTDASPPRRSKKYDSDESPPRKITKNYDSDQSPPRKSHNPRSRADYHSRSPVRKPDRTKDSRQLEPISPSKRRKHSPPKQNYSHKHNQNNRHENSKQRRNSSDSDLSPPRKHKRNAPSPVRKVRHSGDSDQSTPRRDKHRNMSDRDNSKRKNDSPPPSNKKMARTLDGKLAGLQDARQLRQENSEFRRREEEIYNKMSDEVSGRNAKAVRRKDQRDTTEKKQKQKEKAERQKEIDEKYKKWSRGLKQLEDQEARVQDYMHEASKPLARHRDDRDLESNLKQLERDGDPMLKYIRNRKREAGELGPEKPSYKGNFPPNRFNVRPGYRWDGVDRSNGYEKKFFDQQSKKKAQEEEAYKWSTEDL